MSLRTIGIRGKSILGKVERKNRVSIKNRKTGHSKTHYKYDSSGKSVGYRK